MGYTFRKLLAGCLIAALWIQDTEAGPKKPDLSPPGLSVKPPGHFVKPPVGTDTQQPNSVKPPGHSVKPPGLTKPQKPFPSNGSCEHPCCINGTMDIGLGSLYNGVTGNLPGVTVIQSPTAQTGAFARKPCSRTALVKVNFKTITEKYCGDFCLANPYCDRRMLKIDIDLSPDERGSWLFNVGDSISNNGWRGDSRHQSNCAETQGKYPDITVYAGDRCNNNPELATLATFSGAIGSTADHVTLYVSNEHIRVTNNAGFDEKVCHRCLYALNGQPDSGPLNPGPNEDIYIGFNRVVQYHSGRKGHGTCSATLSWTCPCQKC